MKKPIILPAALALVLGATTACTSGYAQAPATPPASGQAAAPTAQQPGAAPQQAQGRDHDRDHRDGHHRFDFSARAEARIAYVKAELKITPAQQAAFDRYAQVIRDNAATTQKTFQDIRGHRGPNQNMSAIDRIEQRAKMAQMRDQYEQQYLAAFRPLYASLSPDQKKAADQLATPHFGHHDRDHRGGPRHG